MNKVDKSASVSVGALAVGEADIVFQAASLLALAQVDAAAAHASLASRLAVVALSRFDLSLSSALAEAPSTAGLALSVAHPDRGELIMGDEEGGLTRVRLRQRFLASSETPHAFLIVASSENDHFAALVDAADARLRWTIEAPSFGLALARVGWIELDGVFAARELGAASPEARGRVASQLRNDAELLHLSIDFGILRAFHEKAKTYLQNQSRPWDSTGLARATDDPHIVRQWGEFAAKLAAFAKLYDEAVSEVGASEARRPEGEGFALATARSYGSSFAATFVSGVIEILGASATSDRNGFDLFWRDLAVHALDAPPVVRLEDIGRRALARQPAAKPASDAPAPPDGNSRASPTARRLVTAEEALATARALAASWSRTAAAIDAERRIPREELRELGRSGLLAITIPGEHGGPGLPNTVLTRIFRILAATDTALAQISQNHFDFVDTLTSAEPSTQQFFYAQLLAGARFGNAIAERGRRSRRDLATTIVPRGDGYAIDGVKAFCTGALTAAWVPVLAIHPDGRILTAYVERATPGLDVRGDWDAFGQRATFSGTTVLTDVFVPAERVVDRGRGDPMFLLAQFAGNQLIHAAIEVGAAEGALDRASEFMRSGEGSPRPRDLERLGAGAVQTQAARALVDRAAALVDEALQARRPTRDQTISALIAVDEAKSLAYAIGPAATGDLLSFAGGPEARQGLDRFWRNSRTHSLHDPIRWRQFFVGNYHLNGALAPDLANRFEGAERNESAARGGL